MRLFCNHFTLQMADIYLPLLVGATVYFAQTDVSLLPMDTSCFCWVASADHEPSESEPSG